MKKLALSLFAVTFALIVVAQEKPKIKEVGIVFSSLDNFGLSFKIGHEKSVWRFNTILIDVGNMEETMDSAVSKVSSVGFGFGFGKEYRKNVAYNFELRYGADLSLRYIHSKSEQTNRGNNSLRTRTLYEPRFNFVFGFNYIIKEQFIIGAEILPYFSYTFGSMDTDYGNDIVKKTDISQFDFGLSNTSIMLSLGYRF